MTSTPRRGSMVSINIEYAKKKKIEQTDVNVNKLGENKKLSILLTKQLIRNKITIFLIGIITFNVFYFMFCSDKRNETTNIYNYLIPVLIMLVTWGVGIVLIKERRTNLNYIINQNLKEKIREFKKGLSKFDKGCVLWNNKESRNIIYSKVEAGCKTSITREKIHLNFRKLPYLLKMNYDNNKCFQYKTKNIKVLFLPDRLVVIKKWRVIVVLYCDMQAKFDTSHFAEEPDVSYGDIKMKYLYSSWKYVNKDGSPDLRFNNNYKVNFYLYGEMTLYNPAGLNLELMCTNAEYLEQLTKLFEYVKFERDKGEMSEKKQNKNIFKIVLSIVTILICCYVISIFFINVKEIIYYILDELGFMIY